MTTTTVIIIGNNLAIVVVCSLAPRVMAALRKRSGVSEWHSDLFLSECSANDRERGGRIGVVVPIQNHTHNLVR